MHHMHQPTGLPRAPGNEAPRTHDLTPAELQLLPRHARPSHSGRPTDRMPRATDARDTAFHRRCATPPSKMRIPPISSSGVPGPTELSSSERAAARSSSAPSRVSSSMTLAM